MERRQKEAHLRDIIGNLGSVAVAFSAGTDSTYLLALCHDILGAEHVLAVTAHSPTLPNEELNEAKNLATHIGVQLEVVATSEMENTDYVRNDANRCFYCQHTRIKTIQDAAHAHGFTTVAYGVTADDVHEHRPGIGAIQQHGIQLPLLDAGMTKADVRALSAQLGLPTHDKPAMACLASRIPYGRHITVEDLNRVAMAEAFLKREFGLRQVRVRHHDMVARIEVESEDIQRLAQPEVREHIVVRLRDIGFVYVALDLAGYGSTGFQPVPRVAAPTEVGTALPDYIEHSTT